MTGDTHIPEPPYPKRRRYVNRCSRGSDYHNGCWVERRALEGSSAAQGVFVDTPSGPVEIARLYSLGMGSFSREVGG